MRHDNVVEMVFVSRWKKASRETTPESSKTAEFGPVVVSSLGGQTEPAPHLARAVMGLEHIPCLGH